MPMSFNYTDNEVMYENDIENIYCTNNRAPRNLVGHFEYTSWCFESVHLI